MNLNCKIDEINSAFIRSFIFRWCQWRVSILQRDQAFTKYIYIHCDQFQLIITLLSISMVTIIIIVGFKFHFIRISFYLYICISENQKTSHFKYKLTPFNPFSFCLCVPQQFFSLWLSLFVIHPSNFPVPPSFPNTLSVSLSLLEYNVSLFLCLMLLPPPSALQSFFIFLFNVLKVTLVFWMSRRDDREWALLFS